MATLTNYGETNSDSRIKSIDTLRGIIMVLMAIDHVRVYSGIPAWDPSYAVFFTRWITNFCAPGFVFLAGSSAYLYSLKIKNNRLLSQYLLVRGLLLVLLEFTIIRFFWTFNFNYSEFLLAGIIWMLGWCMIIMAALIWLKPIVIGIMGLVIIFLQQLFSLIPSIFPQSAQKLIRYIWEFVYPSSLEHLPGITILYVLVPWIGVMAIGYWFGKIFSKEPEKRQVICLWTGLCAILLFIIIGSVLILSYPNNSGMPFLLNLLNQRKYPASQLFLLMTLGPLILAIPFVEKAKGRLFDVFSVFGKVPLFYYLLHIPIIHLGAIIIEYYKEGTLFNKWYTKAPYVEMPKQNQWNLPLLYLEFLCVIVFLYYLCKWYAKYKQTHHEKKWLKYL